MMRAGPRADETTVCRKCNASIMFLQSFNKKTGTKSQMPVNVVPTDSKHRGPYSGETAFVYGEHQSHFMTCPEAEHFRGRK